MILFHIQVLNEAQIELDSLLFYIPQKGGFSAFYTVCVDKDEVIRATNSAIETDKKKRNKI